MGNAARQRLTHHCGFALYFVRRYLEVGHAPCAGCSPARMPLHTRRKTAAAAEAWLGSVATQRLLTLRDPRALSDERRARPCNVSIGPGVVLRCAGHAPARRSVRPPVANAYSWAAGLALGPSLQPWLHYFLERRRLAAA